ncbi:RsmB/NOP family class I SAM-dependent RNA methyltransferase [Candidatus Woesearchaeota archaeon]|nr:RsmB/NOP family class I SAM-dependent RNA methyltransferase [Candidatus Woesearchaeota archaeon]
MNQFLERYEKLGEMFDPKSIVVPHALRVNTLKIDDSSLKKRLNAELEKIPFLSHGYYFKSSFTVGAMPEHFLGLIYIQEAASQLPAEVLDPRPGELVLDMAAAPGSKTTQMAAMMENKGVLVALDASNPRLPALKNNLERCGVSNCLVYKKDAAFAEDFTDELGREFDKVLLDAPCSGNFATDKDWFAKRKVSDLKEMVKVQRKLIDAGLAVLKKGGVMVYSTCSLEPEENEENIDWLLSSYEDVELEKIGVHVGEPGLTGVFGRKLNPNVALCKRLWPHKTGTQGFFIAKIRKL